jgi:amino acid permease
MRFYQKIKENKFLSATSVLIGTAVGAGFLGIPYVASKSGFLVALVMIIVIGLLVMLTNLYMGEISLRTKGKHQLSGYAEIYLGKKGKWLMEFAVIFGIYSAIIAYLFAIGESLSLIILGNVSKFMGFGIFVGILLALLMWDGIKILKKFEKIGVAVVLLLLIVIVVLFSGNINIENLNYVNYSNMFLPLGVIFFSFLCFSAIPHVEIILNKKEKHMKKALIFGSLVPMLIYAVFTAIVVGIKGVDTPEIATFALGGIFIVLGIFTMLNAYLSLGNALMNNFSFDNRLSKIKSWFLAAVMPLIIFLIIQYFEIFSFTSILSIGGIVSGGLTGTLILLMIRKAKKKGNRKPEYKIPINWFIIGLLVLFFVFAVVQEIL